MTVPPEAVPHQPDEDELDAVWRAKLLARLLWFLGVGLGVLLLAAVAVGVWAIRSQQVSNTGVAQETHDNTTETRNLSAQIESCVNPDGQCFKDAQQRTAASIGMINQSNQRAAAAAAACAATLPDPQFAAVYRCVVHTLEGKSR